jgi:hypothetical protein
MALVYVIPLHSVLGTEVRDSSVAQTTNYHNAVSGMHVPRQIARL